MSGCHEYARPAIYVCSKRQFAGGGYGCRVWEGVCHRRRTQAVSGKSDYWQRYLPSIPPCLRLQQLGFDAPAPSVIMCLRTLGAYFFALFFLCGVATRGSSERAGEKRKVITAEHIYCVGSLI